MREGWTLAESLEAHFGKWRVYVRGCDVRGFYSQSAAAEYAGKCGGVVAEHKAYVFAHGSER